MADDKGGGGKSWEPFEVVLVILLAIGLLTKLQGPAKPPSTTTTKPKSAVVSKPALSTPQSCGIAIDRPHTLETVTTFVTLAGSTSGCNWVSTPEVALYAQVIDASGKPVSAYTTVAPTASDGATTSFVTSISLTAQPAKGQGFVILLPAKSTPDQPTTLRIPITFGS